MPVILARRLRKDHRAREKQTGQPRDRRLESLACGLPAITTTTNGSSEIITEGEDGYVIEGATDHLATDIAACVSTFCALRNEARQQMRQNAQRTSEQYSIERNAKELINYLGIK